MAPKTENDNSAKKRIIEFDMFACDLEPEQDEKIRGGGKSAIQHEPDGSQNGPAVMVAKA